MAAAGGHWVKIAQGDIGKMVFVPKGGTAEGVITGVKPKERDPNINGGWPKISELEVIKGLGGSTGAQLVKDSQGNLYVRKTGDTQRLREEIFADGVYRDLGVDVPDSRIYNTKDGGAFKLSKFVEGQTLGSVENNSPVSADKVKAAIKEKFVIDALLANHDVIGLEHDNILVSLGNKGYRIDNGGALTYRAMGQKKNPADFDEFPMQIFSMRVKGSASAVFKDITAQDVKNQAASLKAIVNVKPGIFIGAPNMMIGKTLELRLSRIDQYARIFGSLSVAGKSWPNIETYTKKLWEGLRSGKISKDPFTAKDIYESYAEVMGG